MITESLQDGIDAAGSPIAMLWQPGAVGISVPTVPPEYASWRDEAVIANTGAVLLNLTHHMFGVFLRGPGSLELLQRLSASDLDSFEVGQAKQMIPLTPRGDIITDTILMRLAPEEFVLTGVPSANNWVTYHAERSGLNIEIEQDLSSGFRAPGEARPHFRYQVQGVRAMEIVERALGGPPPEVKFFHSKEVIIADRTVRAFRHGMVGLPGFEFLGAWEDREVVMDALLAAGEGHDLLRAGGMAYYMNGVESGWIPTPTPGIYSDPDLDAYRRYVPLHSFEGMMPLHGSFFSKNIEDYYVTPYELGYGRFIKSTRDYVGREALAAKKDNVTRTKVTIVFDGEDVRNILGEDPGYLVRHVRDRVEIDGEMVGMTMHDTYYPQHGTIMALGIVDKQHAAPGTKVDVVWGDHPGLGASLDAHKNFPRIRGTVVPTPYNQFAREQYRK